MLIHLSNALLFYKKKNYKKRIENKRAVSNFTKAPNPVKTLNTILSTSSSLIIHSSLYIFPISAKLNVVVLSRYLFYLKAPTSLACFIITIVNVPK